LNDLDRKEHFGWILRAILKQHKISQNKVAELIGVPRSAVSQFITGKRAPTLTFVEALLKTLRPTSELTLALGVAFTLRRLEDILPPTVCGKVRIFLRDGPRTHPDRKVREIVIRIEESDTLAE
jgi:transcriptional regulator with XRE-family HTH domain